MSARPVHADFLRHLERKDQGLIDLYLDLRNFILELHPAANELLYHTHALTSVYGHSDRLADAYVHLPIYTAHLNLGFNKGNLLKDPHKLLRGSGNLIRHLPVTQPADYRNTKVKALVKEAMEFALADMDKPSSLKGATISKIK